MCIRDSNKIVINCADLGYVSSVGLGALVRARSRSTKKGAKIYLARIENQVLDVFRLINFDKLFSIFEKESEAIVAIES